MLAASDPLLRRFHASRPATEQEVHDWLAQVEPARLRGDRVELAVTDPEGSQILGAVTLWSVNRRHRNAMANYWVAADARGLGVATRALRLLAQWSFEQLGLARLQLFIDPENDRSRAVAERCGFVHEGTLRPHGERDGQRHDSLVYGLLPSDLR